MLAAERGKGTTYGHDVVAALHTASVALVGGTAGDGDDARSDGKDEGECTNEHDDGDGDGDERTMETL